MMRVTSLLIFISFVAGSFADINMHNPRGSNNRHDESGRARKNANRLFDSQNNNRGGHNVGRESNTNRPMTFYSGSTLYIRWANQHSSGDENNNANVVLQYMCDEKLRDGATTGTIPTKTRKCQNGNCDSDAKYGRHESLTFYEYCASRSRNKGLFTSDQDLDGDSAQFTRQNNNGQRRGYECPEERDHWPYFGPSQWRDIAVFTNDLKKCELYRSESQNVQSKWGCDFPSGYWDAVRNTLLRGDKTTVKLGATEESCDTTATVNAGGQTYSPEWKEFPSHGIAAPECLSSQYSRDNHQGNTIGGHFLTYEWTVPEKYTEGLCALRIRYNISTNDFPYWDTDHTSNGDPGPSSIWLSQGLTQAEGTARGYTLTDDPAVNVFDTDKFTLALAINTAQYGRTFQDRSHAFYIAPRPASIPDDAVIQNINVRGKRGNIVQVYPGTEYDFDPDFVEMSTGDYVHFQWTGSNRNPRNNAGQGARRTDRSNAVQLRKPEFSENFGGKSNSLRTNYPSHFEKTNMWDLEEEDLSELAFSGQFINASYPGVQLNQASVYFNKEPMQINKAGIYHYLSTRNNAFTNRDQKATIVVFPAK